MSISTGYKPKSLPPAPPTDAKVVWSSDVEEVRTQAQKDLRPYVLFFCTESTAGVAGEGRAVWEQWKTKGQALPTPTPFDYPQVVAALSAADLKLFVKVPSIAQNAEMMRQFNAAVGLNTIVICGPNDKSLVTLLPSQCSAQNMLLSLQGFKSRYEAWLKSAVDSMPAQNAVVKPAGRGK